MTWQWNAGLFSRAHTQALLAQPPPDSCEHVRIDLTHLACYTIDDAGTREVDDALSVEHLDGSSGRVRLWVHIADPTRWLQPGSALVAQARDRSRTLYFPWGSCPMFPRVLAEGPFSLQQGEVRGVGCVCSIRLLAAASHRACIHQGSQS
jgi:exoribonuclease-2